MSDQGPATPGTAARCEGTTDEVCPKCTRIALQLANQANAAEATAERLKAENASLLESLREAREEREKALATAEDYDARARAAEKDRDMFRTAMNDADTACTAAEQRCEKLEGALRECQPIVCEARCLRHEVLAASHVVQCQDARAALHDEERRQREQTGYGASGTATLGEVKPDAE